MVSGLDESIEVAGEAELVGVSLNEVGDESAGDCCVA